MRRANKGQIRIIEAFLAVIIVFSAFAVSGNLPQNQKVTRKEDLVSVGLNALLQLDSDGFLGRCIDNAEWSRLREALGLLLPSGVAFNLTVYNGTMQKVNSETIANSGLNSQKTTFVEYICASQNVTFHCYILHLYLAVVA
ncbi:MAG: hypothetical protein QXJ11_03065 [Candidatus Bathyarchaeia archaeon]